MPLSAILIYLLSATIGPSFLDDPLCIQLVPRQPGIIEYDKTFSVVLTNHSDKPLGIWNIESKRGYRQLTFTFENTRTGEKHLVSKPPWKNQKDWHVTNNDREDNQLVTIDAKKSHTLSIVLDEHFWHPLSWKGLPAPNTRDSFVLTAHWSTTATDAPPQPQLWTGTISSPKATVTFVADRLKTPHAYLQHGFTNQAIEIMKADPTWINKKDEQGSTPLHLAASDAHLDLIRWLLNAGADINAEAANRFTPLHYAKDVDVVALLLEKKPDLVTNAWDSPLKSIFKEWSRSTDETDKIKWRQIIDLYLKAGADYDLSIAIYLDNFDKVKSILKQSPHLADDDLNKRTSPLRLAASLGRYDICRYLIENFTVDVNDFQRGVGYPIIKEALRYPNIVKLLIDHKANLKQPIYWQGGRTGIWIIGDTATALHYAANDGVPESITLLLDAGVDLFVNSSPFLTTDDQRKPQTALDVAVYFGKSGNMDAMLRHPQFKRLSPERRQAILDQCLVEGAYPHELAFRPDRDGLVKVLLDHGANPKATLGNKTAMDTAINSISPYSSDEKNEQQKRIVKMLHAKDVPLTLFGAVALGDEAEVTKLLKLNPRSANESSSEGNPALHFAVASSNTSLTNLLLQAGCDANIRNQSKYGYRDDRAIFAAANAGNVTIVKMLLDAGADAKALNCIKQTALHKIYHGDYLAVTELLLKQGADPDARDTDGETPLDTLHDSAKHSLPALKQLFDTYRTVRK